MKRKTLLAFSLTALLGVGIPSLRSNPQGAPSDGRTGSPGDGGKTCYSGGCHSGSPTDATGIISSNIPAEGYTPGTSYTITVSVDGSGKKGFCVSPQKEDGSRLGTLTAGTGNQVVGSEMKYVTHSNYKSTTPAVWTFTWVAPAAGTGSVNFYGAFANNTSITRKTIYSVNEKTSTGVNENAIVSKLALYPNPSVSGHISIGFEVKKSSKLVISLIDITGSEVAALYNGRAEAGSFEEKFDLPVLKNGIYFLRIDTDKEVLTRKLLVQQ